MTRLRVVVDDVHDVLLDLHSRRGRALLLAAGVAAATGALVMSLGVSQVAATQIAGSLAADTLDILTVSYSPGGNESETGFSEDALNRAARLAMVDAAALQLDLEASMAKPGRLPDLVGADSAPSAVRVLGATSGYLDVAGAVATPATQWLLDETQYNVVLLGEDAAASLGIPVTRDPRGYRLTVAGTEMEVVGFVSAADRVDLSSAVVIPYARAVAMAGDARTTQLVVRTAPGAGPRVAAVLRDAVSPGTPEAYAVSQVVDLRSLRRGVQTELTRTSATIGTLLLALMGLLIANSMIVSAVARTGEIGLRRALGASRWAIARLFLVEGGALGFLGGLAGSGVGVVGIVVIARIHEWGAPVGPHLGVAGPALGLIVGLGASAQPSWRAARVSPALAVRMD